MMPVTLNDARAVTARLVASMDPLAVIVFGSVARDGVGNDLDLFMIFRDGVVDGPRFDVLLNDCFREFHARFALEPFYAGRTEFNDLFFSRSPFLHAIIREGTIMYSRDGLAEWREQALEELRAAEYLLQGDFFKGAAVHAQQAVEKVIKAGLLEKGWELEKVHSIVRLRALAGDFKLTLDLSEDDALFLDAIYRGRYPAEAGLLPLRTPVKEDARRAVEIAKRVVGNPQTAGRK